jgi:hypothetical protein
MAAAIRKGFSQLFDKNEYAHKLDKPKLTGLVTEVTGQAAGSTTVRSIVGTFEALKKQADFETEVPAAEPERAIREEPPPPPPPPNGRGAVNLSYTVYLNLPNTENVAVFNAIFRSLRENLLQ